jgi:hypothetical protein
MVSKDYVKDELVKLINSLENDYSKWGDISEWVRKDTIRSLKKIKRKLGEK